MEHGGLTFYIGEPRPPHQRAVAEHPAAVPAIVPKNILHGANMPEPSQARQAKRPRRFWLWAPYVLALIALIAWSGVWWSQRLALERALNDQAARWRKQGYAVSWAARTVDGWPFRLHLTLTGFKASEPSGWSVAAPTVEAVGLPYAPDVWGMATSQGLVLTRPGKGALNVSGQSIRASIGGVGTAAPRLSFEALNLALAPAPGAQAPMFSTADRLELHLQPGPDDQAALLLKLQGARLDPAANLARLTPALDLTWDARLSHVSALKGPGWPVAVRAWTAAGGTMTVADAALGLDHLALQGSGGPLSVGDDGRLRGVVGLNVTKGGGLNLGGLRLGGVNIGGLQFSGAMPLQFQDGRASLGAFPIGPAFKVY